jgi:hypothetical protein
VNKLYKFHVYCGRMGDLDGMFVLDESEQQRLFDHVGRDVYFGEVLGKHSEISVTLESSHLTMLTDDQEWLAKARELKVSLSSGLNPLEYIDEASDGDEDDGE